MMLKTCSFFLICMSWSLLALAQGDSRLTFHFNDVPLADILSEITRQSGIYFAYNPQVINVESTTSFSCEEEVAMSVIERLCTQEYLSSEIVEGQVILKNVDDDLLPSYMLTGFLTDSASGESLISATVALAGRGRGVYSNAYGYYAISLKRGVHRLTFSYVGYQDRVVEITIKKNEHLNLEMSVFATGLPVLTVKPGDDEMSSQQDLGKISLNSDDLNRLPELAGESGLVKNLENVPGVKQHSEISSFFYVRGGERDQNIIYIDDAPIYNPSHLLGLSSMVVPDFANNITVYKSDMPANVGDRLASVISIRTRDGNLNKFQLSGALNPFVNRVSAEIPIFKQRSSIFVSYRRSAYEPLYRQFTDKVDFFFQDFHFKWNYRMNNKNRFFITVIGSTDNFIARTGEVSRILWGNFAASFRWNRTFGPKLFSNTTLYTGNYSYTVTFPPNIWKSELGTISLKSDFTHYINQDLTSNFGVEAQGYFNTPGQLTLDSTTSVLPSFTRNYGRKLVVYYRSNIHVTNKLSLNVGARLINWENLGPMSYYRYNDDHEPVEKIDAPQGTYNSYLNVDPRLSLTYALPKSQFIKVSYGIYHQYLQLISNSISPYTAMELWLTASPHIKPQQSQHWAINYTKKWAERAMQFSGSAYYKTSENQIDFDGHSTIYLNEFLEGELRFGSTEAYGVEFLLKRDFGKLSMELGYTWSRVYRETNDINNDAEYPAFQDRPHDVGLLATFKASDRLSASAYWTSYSGSPITTPTGFYSFNGQTIPIYDERHNDRLPAYHRLDVACRYRLNKNVDKRFQHSLSFSLFNALGIKNIYAVKFNKIEEDGLFPEIPSNLLFDHQLSPSRVELTQFFPSLTYKFNL